MCQRDVHSYVEDDQFGSTRQGAVYKRNRTLFGECFCCFNIFSLNLFI
jgi:hypothetical protein